MTIAIVLKVGDGVVLGADSAGTLGGQHGVHNVYFNMEKISNLRKGLPIGMVTYGLGGLGGRSVTSLAKDLRDRFTNPGPWHLDPANYTIEQVAIGVKEFFYDELYVTDYLDAAKVGPVETTGAPEGLAPAGGGEGEGTAEAPAGTEAQTVVRDGSDEGPIAGPEAEGPAGTETTSPDTAAPGQPETAGERPEGEDAGGPAPSYPQLGFIIAGYSASAVKPEVWAVEVDSTGACAGAKLVYGQDEAGRVSWRGVQAPLWRLLCGHAIEVGERLVAAGVENDEAFRFLTSWAPLAHPSMPLQDAIDLVDYLAQVTCGYVRFDIGAPTVAPPIDIAAISLHERFKWVKRKHYFPPGLNPPPEFDPARPWPEHGGT